MFHPHRFRCLPEAVERRTLPGTWRSIAWQFGLVSVIYSSASSPEVASISRDFRPLPRPSISRQFRLSPGCRTKKVWAARPRGIRPRGPLPARRKQFSEQTQARPASISERRISCLLDASALVCVKGQYSRKDGCRKELSEQCLKHG